MTIRGGIFAAIVFAALNMPAAQVLSPLESGILSDLNRFRADPASYVPLLRQQRQYYRGNLLEMPGQPGLRTQEGVRPLDEAIAVLQSMRRGLGRVTLSAGLSRAAADHVFDTGRRGLTGHTGTDGSDLTKRVARYGAWSGEIGEDITYGANDAREVIIDLLVDDGVRDRAHRRSLLDPRWRYAGVACGPHAVYGTMCVIDFGSNYQTR